jgi:Ca2+-binding RTX toxin-like protein
VGGGITTVNLNFNELMEALDPTAGDFSITHSGGAVTATSAIMTANSLTVVYSGGELSGVLRLQYRGADLVDEEGDQLRFKDISLGTSGADTIDGSARGTHQALVGNAGNDVITGGSGDDLLMGGAGNDSLTGGLGADIFRFITFETGQDTIADFNVTQGDKIDLRGLLTDTGFNLSNLSAYLSLVDGEGQKTLKVDVQGDGDFGVPDMTIVLTNPLGFDADLQTLIDQRVFLV